jgi:hypothetical protein
MPSNPTGLYNLSLPNKKHRTKTYEFVSYEQYWNMKKNTTKDASSEGAAAETASESEAAAEYSKKQPFEVFEMKDLAKTAPLLVALFVKSKAKTMQNGFVNLQLND